MDRRAWQSIVHGVAKSRTWQKQLSALCIFPKIYQLIFLCNAFYSKKKEFTGPGFNPDDTLHSVMSLISFSLEVSQLYVFDDLAIFRSTGQLFYVTSFILGLFFNLGFLHDSS